MIPVSKGFIRFKTPWGVRPTKEVARRPHKKNLDW